MKVYIYFFLPSLAALSLTDSIRQYSHFQSPRDSCKSNDENKKREKNWSREHGRKWKKMEYSLRCSWPLLLTTRTNPTKKRIRIGIYKEKRNKKETEKREREKEK
jgi:hypothetical protein